MSNTYIINITGKDAPDKLKEITKTLSLFKLNILDINQAVIFENLSLEILVELSPGVSRDEFLKEILYTSHRLNLHITFDDIDIEKSGLLNDLSKKRFIITALAKNLTSKHLSSLMDLISQEKVNIVSIERLSRPRVDKYKNWGVSCIEMTLEGGAINLEKLRRDFF